MNLHAPLRFADITGRRDALLLNGAAVGGGVGVKGEGMGVSICDKHLSSLGVCVSTELRLSTEQMEVTGLRFLASSLASLQAITAASLPRCNFSSKKGSSSFHSSSKFEGGSKMFLILRLGREDSGFLLGEAGV